MIYIYYIYIYYIYNLYIYDIYNIYIYVYIYIPYSYNFTSWWDGIHSADSNFWMNRDEFTGFDMTIRDSVEIL